VLGLRPALVALSAYVATILPFAARHPWQWAQGAVLFHLELPPRFDGTTFAATLGHVGLAVPTIFGGLLWVGSAALLAASALVGWRTGLAQALAVCIAGLLGLFFFGKQGNPNYYWFIPGFLLLVLLALKPVAGTPEAPANPLSALADPSGPPS
jgi:hypothetical protein